MKISDARRHSWLLIDPLGLALLVRSDLIILEPESDLLLGAFDAVGAVADVAADILNLLAKRILQIGLLVSYNGVVTTDGTGGGIERVGGTKDGCTSAMSATYPSVPTIDRASLLRPVLTTSRPSQTMATMGPLSMSRMNVLAHCRRRTVKWN